MIGVAASRLTIGRHPTPYYVTLQNNQAALPAFSPPAEPTSSLRRLIAHTGVKVLLLHDDVTHVILLNHSIP